jgi:rRNA-processing protein EBP2
MNIRTKRPEDYFAQMAKTDEHMNKIRTKLLSKEQGQERAEKMSKLRELKKYGKKVQVEVQQKRLKEKKDMMDEMKKIRKGQGGNMDFLENGGGKGQGESKGAVAGKRNAKDKKFGFGGKKRHLKKNDKSSTDDVSGFKPFNKGGAGGKFGGKSGAKGGNKGKGPSKRPGKGNRQKMKSKKK